MNVASVFEDAGIHQLSEEEKNEIEVIYQKIQENYKEGIELLQASSAFEFLCRSLETLEDHFHQKSRTAITYRNHVLDYVNVLKQFIPAERSGDWDIHLYALERMLNLFTATGHLNYAKCRRLHLQQIRNLNDTKPWIYKCFKEKGYHTVRCSDQFWANLWTDLIIEQVMMHSLKKRGSITRGGGMSDSVKLV